jgi:hypothetical protein
MKNIVIATLAVAISQSVAAASLEIGAGISKANPTADEIWWQSGAPHKLNMTSPMFTLGMRGDAWRTGYMYLGHYSINSIDTATYDVKPGDYNPCNGINNRMYSEGKHYGPACANFNGSGTVQGLYALWTPTIAKGFKAEIGPYIHTTAWRENIYANQAAICQGVPAYMFMKHTNVLKVDAMLGISYDFNKHISAAVDYVKLSTSGGNSNETPPGYRNKAILGELRVRF